MALTPHKAFRSVLVGRAGPEKLLATFRPYALPALVRMPVTGEPQAIDDLCQAFLVRVMRCQQADRVAMPIPEFLELLEKEIHFELGERFKRLADLLSPRWKRVKDLRDVVTSVLARLPAPPLHPPATLRDGDDLDRDRVALATAWALDHHRLKRDTRALTWKLVFMYDPNDVADLRAGGVPPQDVLGAPAQILGRHLQARRTARLLEGDLGEELTQTLMRRLSGESVLQIATADKVPTAAVQGDLRRAEAYLRNLVRSEELDLHPNQLGLNALIEIVARQRAEERGR